MVFWTATSGSSPAATSYPRAPLRSRAARQREVLPWRKDTIGTPTHVMLSSSATEPKLVQEATLLKTTAPPATRVHVRQSKRMISIVLFTSTAVGEYLNERWPDWL